MSASTNAGPRRRRARSRGGPRPWWAIALGAAGVVALAVVLAQTAFAPKAAVPARTSVRATVGAPAPDLLLASADRRFQLSDLRGRPVLLYFSFPG